MTWADLLQKIYDSPVGTAVRESGTLFPWIESLHVLMITTVVGTIAIVDLRLIGYGAHRRSARQLTADLLPFTWVAFALAVVTGVLLFASDAVNYWANGPFRFKLIALALAGLNMAIFHLTTERKIVEWEDAVPPLAARIAGATSLGLWILIVFLGRWIGFTISH
ncbi:hypothetical protein AZA_87726 [Nitrospirillum viridazoti Y2]|uniref:DUF6644 domain-containing protein n=1 Tax=Nitrospirillum amazonense TaxID=28077 RepID=A0A560HMD2_9PROT|nr:DUF6644 family protein [Nitrospirillum amazonense]EGY02642.1 hypothetical protein AZA_87726 [Nitrospirillum amazonense Y2]TWB46280.1 hypothetical protein FBZ92_1591 [Nitrospirillum amazonense]